jgi:hypothetical protein
MKVKYAHSYLVIFLLIFASLFTSCGKKDKDSDTGKAEKSVVTTDKKGSSVNSENAPVIDENDPNRFKFNRNDYNVGDHVWFGSFEQDRRENNGTEPIEWEVIAKEDDRMLLYSTYILANRNFNTSDRKDVNWSECDLRIWLNDKFLYEAFSEEERESILLSKLSNKEYDSRTEWYVSAETPDTEDYIFLPSIEELETYLTFDASCDGYSKVNGEMVKTSTSYASAQLFAPVSPQAALDGAMETKWTNTAAFVHDAKYEGNYYSGGYWIRSNVVKGGLRSNEVGYISCDHIQSYSNVTYEWGVRPCMWVSLHDVGSAGKNPNPETEKVVDDGTEDRGGVKVKPTANANIEWVDYTSDDGYVSMKIPKGWDVHCVNEDVIIYTVNVLSSDNSSIRFIYTTTDTSYESQDAIDMLMAYGGRDRAPISTEATTESLFTNSTKYYKYSDFEIIDDLGDNGYGGRILQAKAINRYGENIEGIFSAAVIDMGTNYVLGTNVMFDLDEGVVMMIAPEEEFVDWQPVLSKIYESMYFSDSYWRDRNAEWAKISNNASKISQSTRAMSDSVMSSWKARNNSYDIRSQAYSDTTLGRERIYDKETGEIYYAKNGWYDSYSGNRYERIENGSALYNQAVTGTISE